LRDLWVGGALRLDDIGAIAAGDRPATPAEHDLMATAMNDHFVDHLALDGLDERVALWRDLAPLA
jgi:hypothetical protein